MSMETLYLSGRMTGLDDWGAAQFDAAAKVLRANDHHVISPVEIDRKRGFDFTSTEVSDQDRHKVLQEDLAMILTSRVDGVCLLDNWKDSEGAKIERRVAEAVGKPVYHYRPDAPRARARCEYTTEECLAAAWQAEEPKSSFEEAQTVLHKTGRWPAEWLEKWKVRPNTEISDWQDRPLGGEERVTDPNTGGSKGRKLARFDLLPAIPLAEVAELYGAGAMKYEDRNWEKSYAWSLSFGAMQRHAWKFWAGEDVDPETHKHHLASVVFHCLALMEFGRKHPEQDDRPAA